MSRIFVGGCGAVSPAGWGFPSLRDAMGKGEPLPTQTIDRPGWDHPLRLRKVPAPAARPSYLAHARLRRSSPISHYAMGAGLEALGDRTAHSGERLGVVFTVMCGCVRYSRQFFDEVLQAPATASPMLFPETVYNAPASHLSSVVGSTSINYTLVGDDGVFLIGLATAADWLRQGRVDRCLVVAAEETDWLTADSFRHFNRQAVVAEGAGAVLLQCTPSAVELDLISDPRLFTSARDRYRAAQEVREEMPRGHSGERLFDSTHGIRALDGAEAAAWGDWTGSRSSAKPLLGEGFSAGAAWQTALACEAIEHQNLPAAQVVVVGCHQQAIAARFVRNNTSC